MSSPVGVVNRLVKKAKPRHDDDWTDRIHYVLAPSFLLFMATLHGMKQYFGKPVQCFPPAQMLRKQWLNYAESLCFVENTYFVGMTEPFPMERVDRDERQLHYYQWVPFLLSGQALLFILPKLLWKAFNGKTGLDIGALLDRCDAIEKWCQKTQKLLNWCQEEKAGSAIGIRMARTLQHNIEWRHRGKALQEEARWKLSKHFASEPLAIITNNYVTPFYLGFKLLNVLVAVGQLVFLNQFFSPDEYDFWGFGALSDLLAGMDWRQSGRFPRVTFCDVLIRQPQKDMPPLRYTFQCLMPMNLYNEKIFLLVWFCLFALTLFSFGSFLLWCYRLLSWTWTNEFIHAKLHIYSPHAMADNQPMAIFIREWLGKDGCTVLQLMDRNCSPLITVQIVGKLWELFWAECERGIALEKERLQKMAQLEEMNKFGGHDRIKGI